MIQKGKLNFFIIYCKIVPVKVCVAPQEKASILAVNSTKTRFLRYKSRSQNFLTQWLIIYPKKITLHDTKNSIWRVGKIMKLWAEKAIAGWAIFWSCGGIITI